MGLHSKAELKPHKTKGAISVQVLKGEIRFITEEKSVLMK
jgi:quercetin dioxygenase-like cupin family protein